MTMLSLLIPGIALIFALVGAVVLAGPPQPSTNNGLRSFHADHDDHGYGQR